MSRIEVIRTSVPTAATLVSSGLHPVAAATGLRTRAEEALTTTVAASTARVSLDRVAALRALSTRSRRTVWARTGPSLSVDGIAATFGAPPPRAAAAADEPDAVAPAASARQPMSTPRAELTIDSLRSYDLVKPIPVVVESLGDRHYVAEVPDLNISTSASSLSDILIILKDRVAQTYDGLRIKKNLDNEQAHQLKILETYIGKARRGWLDRR